MLSISDGDLRETLQHIVYDLSAAHPDREIGASFNFPNSISVDPSRIAQMVSYLLSNAVTHECEITPVNITSEDVNGELEITVTNGGPAIQPSHIEKLFLAFKRGEGRSGAQGLGLGLYIASQIGHALWGQIDVHSLQDRASRNIYRKSNNGRGYW